MFTGLVEGIGTVKAIQKVGRDMILTIVPPFETSECRVGESISVDGVCLTVTGIKSGAISMDVSEESISRSTLGTLRQGSKVNIERALKLSDRLDGHLVLGHVDGIGRIIGKIPRQRSWTYRISMDAELTRYTVEKGSIAIDGISLTINKCFAYGVEVNIIPKTAEATTLEGKGAGDLVNIETDIIGKYIERLTQKGIKGALLTHFKATGSDSNIFSKLGE